MCCRQSCNCVTIMFLDFLRGLTEFCHWGWLDHRLFGTNDQVLHQHPCHLFQKTAVSAQLELASETVVSPEDQLDYPGSVRIERGWKSTYPCWGLVFTGFVPSGGYIRDSQSYFRCQFWFHPLLFLHDIVEWVVFHPTFVVVRLIIPIRFVLLHKILTDKTVISYGNGGCPWLHWVPAATGAAGLVVVVAVVIAVVIFGCLQ